MLSSRNNFTKKLRALFLSFDMFGISANVTVKKQEKYNSLLGAAVSFIIMGFCLFTFITMFLDMISGDNPNVISSIEFTKNPELIELKKENFTIGVTILDKFSQSISQQSNYTIFIPFFEICIRRIDSQYGFITNCSISYMKPCTEINNELFSQIDEMGVAKQIGYCIDDKVWEQKVELEGFSSSPVFKFLIIKIKKCTNDTYPGIICAPTEVIHEKLIQGFFGVFFSDRLIQQKQLGNPYTIYGKTLSTTITDNTYTQIQTYFRHSYSTTIENFYFYFGQKQYTNHEIQFEKLDQYQQPQPQDSSDFVRFSIQLDDKKITYYRTYDNVLNIFGDIGGLLSLIIFLVDIILGPIQKILLNLFLAKQIFFIQFNNAENNMNEQQKLFSNKVGPERFHEFRDRSTPYSKVLKSILNNEKQNDVKLNGLKQIFKFKFNQQNLGIIDYFFLKNKKILDENIDKIYEKIDIIYLIKKIMEIDKLKFILLSNDQIKLFEYLPKPIINLHNELTSNYLIESRKNNLNQSFVNSIQEAYFAYKNIKSLNQSELDQKLLNMMDKNLKVLFEETIGGGKEFIIRFFLEFGSQEYPSRLIDQISSPKNKEELVDIIDMNKDN